jgi:hypothetical protein
VIDRHDLVSGDVEAGGEKVAFFDLFRSSSILSGG